MLVASYFFQNLNKNDSHKAFLITLTGCTANVDGDTPFHCAAEYGHSEICTFFVKCGLDKNQQNKAQQTPYGLAEINGHFGVCKVIRPMKFYKNMFLTHGQDSTGPFGTIFEFGCLVLLLLVLLIIFWCLVRLLIFLIFPHWKM